MTGKLSGMSVEQPLWRALTGFRILTLCYVLGLFVLSYGDYGRPLVGVGYLAVLTVWTVSTLRKVTSAEHCTPRFLAGDLVLAVVGILLSPVADPHREVGPTLPSIWVAGAVLAFAVKAGWRWAAAASGVVGLANLVENNGLSRSTVHNVVLVCVASVTIGYVVEVARASERALARAMSMEAATRERERLARDIHDGVLQVLAMVQRRGGALGGEAAELGRLAGEQETALRTLINGGRVPAQPLGGGAEPEEPARLDLRALLAARSRGRVSFAGPGGPVLLPAPVARELDAAVAAALDNVRRHAGGGDGGGPRAWILLEDEPDAVLITVRDEGPGIPAGRLAAAEAEGRMGVSLSIRGRLRELGGSAEWVSVPGQGTEVELRMPKHDG
ncbi:DUF5931 domain-containing protein [Streptomyces sp. ACA25]|uniref:MacS family sensor histidine kinase n=1 Tax=Streptomyces sp. ACA25 TaxID=3022596 RepID=UPI0023072F80|nr:DUF5931 domain-containing protein [Streptomyces sp. ACA25]MDB1089901.1 DUF5931 domain-containing protein [Streptomyces sp. ACA25]